MKVIITIDPTTGLDSAGVLRLLRGRIDESPAGDIVNGYVVLDDTENIVLAEADNTTQRRGTAADHRPQVGDQMYYYGGRNEYHGSVVTITFVGDTYFHVDIPGWGASSGVRDTCLSWHDRSVPYSTADTRPPVERRTILSDPPRVGDRLFYYGNTHSWHGRSVTVVRTTNVGGGDRQRWWVTFDDHPDDHRDNCSHTSLRWNRR